MQFSQLLLSAKGGKKGAGAGAGIAKTSKASKGKGDKGGKGEKDGEVEKRNVAHNKMTKIEVAQVPLKKSKGEAEGGEEEEEEEGGEKEDEDALIKEQTKFTGTQQMVISISSMVLSRMIFKVDYSDPQTLMLARLAFAAYLLLSQALFWFLRRQVTIRDDRHVLQKTSVGGGLMGAGLTAVMSGDPAAILGALSGKKEGKEQLMTVKQHDLAEIRKLASSVLFELLGVTFVHFVNKNTAPLLLVSEGAHVGGH
ncbi:hypothetical protein B484DRAFT_36506 [Ochromonadaceae sp. CCMP2298]|nr:hypothetical protein B484DRAFT_36506 [Ochromonadaceae sp. CCMP2298]